VVRAVGCPFNRKDALLECRGIRITLVLETQLGQCGQHRDQVRVVRSERAFLRGERSRIVVSSPRVIPRLSGKVSQTHQQAIEEALTLVLGGGDPQRLIAIVQRVLELACGPGRIQLLICSHQLHRLAQRHGW